MSYAGFISGSGGGGGRGTVTSVNAGNGINVVNNTTNPIVSLNIPVTTQFGGTGLISPTPHSILIAEGMSAFTPIVLSDGQLLIGSTGNDPVAAELTAGSGISIVNAAGSITISATNSGTVTSVSGTADRITSTGGATPVIDIAATYIGQTSITTLGTITSGVWNGTAIDATHGGTAQTSWSTGDLLYASGVNTLAKRTIGSTNDVLTVIGGVPTWQAPAASGVTSVSGTANRITSTGGTTPVIDISASYVGQASITTLGTITSGVWNGTAIDATHGGTAQTSWATGDLLYASGVNTLAKLAAGSNTNVLTLVGGVPSWQAPAASGITGTVAQFNVVVGLTSSSVTSVGPGTAGQVLQSGGAASNPVYSTATYPSTAGTSGKILISNGTNIVSSTPTYPNSATATGTILRADGTNWVATTATYPATTTTQQILYSSSANTVAGLAVSAVPGSLVSSDGTNTVYYNQLNYSTDWDDFTGYFQGNDMVTKLGWKDNQTNSGTVTFNTATLVEAAHPGIVILGTSTTNNAQASICLCNAGNVGCWLLGGGSYYFRCAIKIPTLSTSGERFAVYMGLADDKGGATNEQCWFTYSDNLNSGQWVGQTRTGGGATTSVNSSVTVTTSWTVLEITVNAAANSVNFLVNGTSIGTTGTAVPTAKGIGWLFQIIKSVGTTARSLYADYFWYSINLTASR